ncbi:MAG: GyrI-like domain-containing protein [Alphaproteobacteria bacterium]|nr:GyrI-like domain-containing protein [Alphaproteobacteria bacterium]
MEQTKIQLPETKLVGLRVRTNNMAEMAPLTAKISPCVQQYFQEQWAEEIPHRTHPGRTFCAYTNYESDYRGDYTFYIGEEVSSLEDIPEGLESHIIPPQTYVKFTTPSGSMPTVLINAWQAIWKMSPESLGGERRYHTDFEIYDERASDPQDTILDIYIGVK